MPVKSTNAFSAPKSASNGAYTAFLVLGMMVTGTMSTLMNKWQDEQCVNNCEDPNHDLRKKFEQPVWQTMIMFIGEFMCFAVYGLGLVLENHWRWRASSATSAVEETAFFTGSGDREPLLKSQPGQIQSEIEDEDSLVEFGDEEDDALTRGEKPPMSGWRYFFLALPAICDITATTMMNVGLLAVSASVYQMLRGSVVLWTGFLSFTLLKIRLPAYKIYAMFVVLLGIMIVGASPIFFEEKQPKDTNSEIEGVEPKLNATVGVLLIFGAQIFSALQFVIEEKILRNYSVEPVKMVGFEGLFGMLIVSLGMVVLYPTVGHDTEGLLDVIAGWHQIINNPILWGSAIASCFSIGAFNYFGLNITRVISATSRTTIDTCRTLFVWIISLSLAWESFLWLQVIGFVVLIYGTFVFNRVIGIVPFITPPAAA